MDQVVGGEPDAAEELCAATGGGTVEQSSISYIEDSTDPAGAVA
jgi:hypothetical protein